jgi:hypothetical protein
VRLVTFADERPMSLLDRVREEWPLDGADVDADVRAWREGAELYEDSDDDELLQAGELMARAVRHHLYGLYAMREDDLAVTVHSLLFAAGTPSPDGAVSARACRLARLALAVIAQHGWQPLHLGGNGHVTAEIFEDADIQRLLTAALGPDADIVSFFLWGQAP